MDIPYGDYFTVHLRWEARQVGSAPIYTHEHTHNMQHAMYNTQYAVCMH